MKIDCVFSGGGVKAFSFIGSLQSIESHRLHIERVAGTSAGAIVASLVAANYTIQEISQMINELDLEQFLDAPKLTKIFPFSKWIFLYFQLGIYKGNQLEKWLYQKLAAKNIFTFKDIKKNYLKVVVSDLTLGKLVVVPDDLQRIYGISSDDFSVATAVRMSAGFPYFFMPKEITGKNNQKSIIVDGGLLSNFPLWVFENSDQTIRRPVLGVKLSSTTEEHQVQTTKNAFEMFHALFSTMKLAHDARYISKSKQNNIIFIPTGDVQTTDFHIDEGIRDNLIKIGKISSDKFLKFWPN